MSRVNFTFAVISAGSLIFPTRASRYSPPAAIVSGAVTSSLVVRVAESNVSFSTTRPLTCLASSGTSGLVKSS